MAAKKKAKRKSTARGKGGGKTGASSKKGRVTRGDPTRPPQKPR